MQGKSLKVAGSAHCDFFKIWIPYLPVEVKYFDDTLEQPNSVFY